MTAGMVRLVRHSTSVYSFKNSNAVFQLKNEMWIFRGSVARDSRTQIMRLYNLTTPESILERANGADERDNLKVKYTRRKVESLLSGHRYLKLVTKDTPVSPSARFRVEGNSAHIFSVGRGRDAFHSPGDRRTNPLSLLPSQELE